MYQCESYLYACAEPRKVGKVGVAAIYCSCYVVQQRRAACLLGAIVADTAGETLRDSRDLVYMSL